jgi:hypothetical protein
MHTAAPSSNVTERECWERATFVGKFAGVSSPEKKHSAHSEQREDSMLVLQKLGSFSLNLFTGL